jgi:hypothetical protein
MVGERASCQKVKPLQETDGGLGRGGEDSERHGMMPRAGSPMLYSRRETMERFDGGSRDQWKSVVVKYRRVRKESGESQSQAARFQVDRDRQFKERGMDDTAKPDERRPNR